MLKTSFLSFTLCLAACGGISHGTPTSDAAVDAASPPTPLTDAAAVPDSSYVDHGGSSNCADEARWVYVVDSDDTLLRFEPDTKALTKVGVLDCPGDASPFSMAVARDGTAYVLHDDQHIYKVSTKDASCQTTPYVPNAGFGLFGMGFVSNEVGSDAETLYVAGNKLGALDLTTWAITPLGSLSGSPELTGNGNAELWGFFPNSSPMAVHQIDKKTGAALSTFDVSSVSGGIIPTAWAFAFWGGRYYIFYQAALDFTNPTTSIYRLTPDTKLVEPVLKNTGHSIVGAGVSTCAPTMLY
jgi:hypothetical protein